MSDQSKPPRPPKRLRRSGRALWRDVVAEYVLTAAELRLLGEVCAVADRIDALEQVLAEEGVVSEGSTRQRVVHPAVSELRQQQLAFGRLLAQLSLPDPEGGVVRSPRQLRAQRAAQAQWRVRQRQNEAG
jgi:hypothetical protein